MATTSDLRATPHTSRGGAQELAVALLVRHEIARRGLQEMLSSTGSVAAVHPVETVHETLGAVENGCEMVVVQADVDDDEASELLTCGARILVVVGDTPGSVPGALRNAHGFVMGASLTVHRLARAIEDVVDGEGAIPRSLAAVLMQNPADARQARVESRSSLTPREEQVLTLLGDGLSNKEIGRRLRISEHGVKRYVANILMKLDCPNRTVAVARAMKSGLLRIAD